MCSSEHLVWSVPFEAPELSVVEAEALARDTGFFGNTGDPLLETVVALLEELRRPDAAFDVIQIAGTNGKTSTARYTAAVLAGEGLRVALYTSPELVEMRERMEVEGKPVSPAAFARGVSLAAEAGRRMNAHRQAAGEQPYRVTEFDLLTVAACITFAEAHVDVAVLEVGLGGRWDATTATHPKATCVTGIGLDHIHVLGDTLEAIAAEKAAVIKCGQVCVLGAGTRSPASVEDVFLSRCAAQSVMPVLLYPDAPSDAPGELEANEVRTHPELPSASYRITRRPKHLGDNLVLDVTTPWATHCGLCAIQPAYQAANIACATTLAEAYLGHALDSRVLPECIARCPTPGRFSALTASPLHLIDAAHNPQSVRAFLRSLKEMEPTVGDRFQLLCAILRDKDYESIVGLLAPEFSNIVVTATSNPRALPAHDLAEVFRSYGVRPCAVYDTVSAACTALNDTAYLAVGSITLAGEVTAWHQKNTAICAQSY